MNIDNAIARVNDLSRPLGNKTHITLYELKSVLLAMKEPVQPPTEHLCVCGHAKSDHIYHEGACRPGFECEEGCKEYRPTISPASVGVQRRRTVEEINSISEHIKDILIDLQQDKLELLDAHQLIMKRALIYGEGKQ